MNKHFLAVAMTVVAVSAVLATGMATASLGATAAAQTATKLSLSVSPTNVYAGGSITLKGRLADANGKGIPNQVIHINSQAKAMGITRNGQNNTKTDASGNFGGTKTVQFSGVPSSVTQATVTLTTVYDGNAQYAASQSSPVTITVHFS